MFGVRVFEVRDFAVPGFGFRVCGSGFHFRSSRFGVLEVRCFRGSGFCAPRIRDFLFWGSGFWLFGVWVRVFQVMGFGYRYSDSGFRGFRIRVGFSGSGLRGSGFWGRGLSFRVGVSGVRIWGSSFSCSAFGV